MNAPEEFLARLIHHLAEKCKGELILKGGMQLRLLNSPRSTQDIDYVLVSQKSKKELLKTLEKGLKTFPGITFSHRLNSRGIFLDLQNEKGEKALIEINVIPFLHLPSEPLSTFPLASRYSLSARVVSTLALPEAYSHKIAAALERDAWRDFYDLTLFETMGSFDEKTLEERLANLSLSRTRPKKVSFKEAAQLFRKKLERLTEDRLEKELYPLIPVDQRKGVLRLIQAVVGRLIQKLEAQEEV